MTLKSPLTGSIGSANSGGKFGAYLKKAGVDGIMITGKASNPKYISIMNGNVELHEADDLWGKDVFDTDDLLQEKHTDSGFKMSVACIGPPAEDLSPMTGIVNDQHRAAGRTGVGAVMGSKNLKAIIAGGNQKVKIHSPKKFKKVSRSTLKKIKDNGVTGEGLPTYGTAVLVNIVNNIGALPTNNWQTAHHETAEKISGETLSKDHLIRKNPCWGCSIACGRMTKVDAGPYKVEKTEGPEYESIWAFGTDCGVDDMPAVIRANTLCDKYGLDTITMGSTVACAMEMAEKGYLPQDKWSGVNIKFGSGKALTDLVELTGKGEGIGKDLRKGSLGFAKIYGHPELSMSVKGLEMPAYDPRGVKGIGLNYATANRGGCHVTGYTISPEVIGLPEEIDRLKYEGKPTWVKIFQDFTATVNSTVNCLFTTFALGAGDFADLLSHVTGWDIDDGEILTIGERIYNTQRLIMEKLGVKNQDTLPKRLLEEPLPSGPSKGEGYKLEDMLQEYYKLRGWTNEGVPTKEKIEELQINNIELLI
jgi:aldehyde:ferredoxin oxidoreductase